MIIVDTNVVSELMRPAPDAAVREWVGSHDTRLHTTSISLAEIRYGIERLPNGRRKDLLRTAADDVFVAFEDQVLPFDAAAALEYASIVTNREDAGSPIDGFDAQIAAICSVHRATLATRNGRAFRDTGIDVLNPWQQT